MSVAQTRRVLFAKQLIHETRMPMAEVALAAGFGSIRRFNEAFRHLFHRPPSALRHKTATADNGVTLRLRYRAPYDWESILHFLHARAIPEVEIVEDGHYFRTVEMDGSTGTIEVSHQPEQQNICVKIRFPNVKSLPSIVARVRRQFDLSADIETIEAQLSSDPILAPLIARRPGLRAPGGWDGFELAVRAILGQQISIAAARRLAGQIVTLHGKPLPKGNIVHPGLSRLFPTPKRLANAKSIGLGMPAARLATLKAMAEAAAVDNNLFRQARSIEETIDRLKAIRGIGEWTAQYIALRAIREMDAFPATDVGLLRGAALVNRAAMFTSALLLKRAESWRPWRAYAAQHLWASDPALLQTKGQNA
jgi:AraC family transcriptional regulator of adaptative response / DNA-3-methyladenine glycosylase II